MLDAMTTRQRAGRSAASLARRSAAELGRELLMARLTAGLSQKRVAAAAGVSASQVSRLERGVLRSPALDLLYRTAHVLGLSVSLKLYPAGSPVRDAAQLALLARFAARLHGSLVLRREVPLPIPGDRRAWDGRIEDRAGGRSSLEAESKLLDAQAVARRIALKQRDDPKAGPVVLLLNRTAHNRRVLAEHRESLRAQFPLDGGAILRAVAAGRTPPASGILLL